MNAPMNTTDLVVAKGVVANTAVKAEVMVNAMAKVMAKSSESFADSWADGMMLVMATSSDVKRWNGLLVPTTLLISIGRLKYLFCSQSVLVTAEQVELHVEHIK